jgi:hypothetical protein
MTEDYRFSADAPPLMKDFGRDAIFAIPSERLSKTIGSSTWETTKVTVPDSDGKIDLLGIEHDSVASSFTLTRLLAWDIIGHFHVTASAKQEIRIIKGWAPTEKQAMEQSIGTSLGASGIGLNAQLKADLQIVDTTIQEWHEEKFVNSSEIYDGNTFYLVWQLTDTLVLEKTEVTQHYRANSMFGSPTMADPPATLSTRHRLTCRRGLWLDGLKDSA